MSLTFGHVIISKVYGFTWWLARPVLRRNRRLAEGWAHRQVPEGWAEPADIWFQAASGGEAYLVWEVLQNLPTPWSHTRVLVTTWTRQGLEVLQGMRAKLKETRPDLHIQVSLFPLDSPNLMHRAVRMVKPKVVVLLETELWPGLLVACSRHRVPVLVLNGRLTPKSLRGYKILNLLMPSFWHGIAPKAVAAMADEDATRYAELFGRDVVQVFPNIKFDRAVPAALPAVSPSPSLTPPPLTSPSMAPPSMVPPSIPPSSLSPPLVPSAPPLAELLTPLQGTTPPPLVLLASVREEEEPLLVPLITRLRATCPKTTLIIAPRHMHRVTPWMERLQQAHCPVVLRSTLTPNAPALAGTVILWDAFGELTALYALATAVFVGGSLAPLGGQNFLEPLAFGRIPCVGPYLDNFKWTLEPFMVSPAPTTPSLPTFASPGLAEAGLLHICRDAHALGDRLVATLAKPLSPVKTSAKASNETPAATSEHPTEQSTEQTPNTVRARFDAWLIPRLGGTMQSVTLLEKTLAK